MGRVKMLLIKLLAIASLGLVALPQPAVAASVLIWPLNPIIEPGRNGAVLWLENRGQSDVVLQIRVMRWSQEQGGDLYSAQEEVLASPPMVRIVPKARQLVRLVLADAYTRQGEQAFRVIVDEIPTSMDNGGEAGGGAKLQFRMRYAIPLFVYDQTFGSGRKPAAALEGGVLSCTFNAARRSISISNGGNMHARLTNVVFEDDQISRPLSPGLLGYVLPGSKMEWPLPDGFKARGTLKAIVNDSEKQVTFDTCSNE